MIAVTILSGGLDSTVLAYMLNEHHEVHALSFDYGQRHKRELDYAVRTGDKLYAHDIIDLRGVSKLLTGSALTDPDVDVPEGHYAEPTMRLTVVPNRNAMMLSIATAVAVAEGAEGVYFGVHAGDHPVYPDCRPQFVDAFSAAMRLANEGFVAPSFAVMAPYATLTKAEIVEIGDALGVPWLDTWSCYQGGDVHCGRCSTCVERAEAFAIAGVTDPTKYADPDYWRSVV